MSVSKTAVSTNATSGVIYAAYGRGQDAKNRTVRAVKMSYWSHDLANTPEAWCWRGLEDVKASPTKRTNQAILLTQSFSPDEFDKDDPEHIEKVHRAGVELAQELCPNSPYFVGTHADAKGGHLHNHIVVLNHDYKTGKAAPKKAKKHSFVKPANDRVMKRLRMQVLEAEPVHLTQSERRAQKAGRSIDAVPLDQISEETWRATLRAQIDALVGDEKVQSMEDFFAHAPKFGLSVRRRAGKGRNAGKEYLSYALVGDDDKKVRLNGHGCQETAKRLGADYTFEGVRDYIAARIAQQQFIEVAEAQYEEEEKINAPESTTAADYSEDAAATQASGTAAETAEENSTTSGHASKHRTAVRERRAEIGGVDRESVAVGSGVRGDAAGDAGRPVAPVTVTSIFGDDDADMRRKLARKIQMNINLNENSDEDSDDQQNEFEDDTQDDVSQEF